MRVKLLMLASVLFAGPVWAQSDQVHRGPVPAWVMTSALLQLPTNPSGPVFIRRQDAEVHLSDQGQAQYLGYRLKILQSSALQLGNVSIKWNPAAGAPIVHQIKIYRDGQVIDALKDATFEVLRREDQLEAAKLDGTLTAVFRVPDLRVGDELEVELTSFSRDPTLGLHDSGLLVVSPSPPPGRYHLSLGWEGSRKPNFQMTADMTAAAVKSERAVDFRFDNPAVLSPPKDAPPRYLWQHVLEYSDFADWEALSRSIAPLFEKAAKLAPDSPVRLEASRIAAAEATPMKRASAALKLVQQDVRYVYVGLNGGNLTPASADETWQRRYGDCKGKTALLLALLNELGISSEPVLINSNGVDDGFDRRLPQVQLFDHVLVRAHIDGTAYWLDGTLPAVATPSLRPVYDVSWVLPLSTRGSSIEKLPWRPATTPDEIHLYEIDARAGFDKPARITTTQITRGLKGLLEQIQFSSVSASQLLDIYRQRETGDVMQAIDDVQWRYDQKAAASILMISGTGKVDWEDDGAGARSLAIPEAGLTPQNVGRGRPTRTRMYPSTRSPSTFVTSRPSGFRAPLRRDNGRQNRVLISTTLVVTTTARGSSAMDPSAWSMGPGWSSQKSMPQSPSMTTPGSARLTTAWAISPTILTARMAPLATERRCRPPMTSIGRLTKSHAFLQFPRSESVG